MPRTKPILFGGPMIRALLDGRKTQTRRVIKPVGSFGNGWPTMFPQYINGKRSGDTSSPEFSDLTSENNGTPLYMGNTPICPGDLLWVREAWSGRCEFRDVPPAKRESFATPDGPILREDIWYWADGAPETGDYERPRPPLFMPRWASRITLEVTAVRAQRLQEISQEDARAEGVATEEWDDWRENVTAIGMPEGSYIETERDLFRDLWDSINAKRGYGWDTNPWVIALTFVVHQMNIDDFLAQREAA